MNSRFGPIRLIALKCGKFDYAEVELDQPLHLVGPNNVGKTSLISLLQFLYLDDQRSMRFSRDLKETRKYYFPTVHSYALFECLTPTGYQTIGVHGCGPVKQYEFERFAYMGRYDASLFLDADRRVRDFDAVKADLAAKQFTPMTASVLRAALTGVGDGHKVMLGLVPAKNRDTYSSFKELFCNILRLSHIRQDEMKKLLLSLFSRSFHQPDGIDLAKTYQENFAKVKRDTQAVQMIKDLVPDIERALQHRTKRDAARSRLPGLYRGLMSASQDASNTLQHERATATTRRTEIDQELEQAEAQNTRLQQELLSSKATLTRVEDWLAETEKLEESFADYLPDWSAQRIQQISKRSDELARRLGNLNEEPVADVKARLGKQQQEQARLQERLKNIENASIQILRDKFTPTQLADAFRLLNPELLGLSTDSQNGNITIHQKAVLDATIKDLLSKCKEGTYSDAAVSINLNDLVPPALDSYADPNHLQTEIGRLAQQIKRDVQRCRDAEEAGVLRQEKTQLEEEKHALILRQDKWQDLCTRRAEWAERKANQQKAARQVEELQQSLAALKIKTQEYTLEQQSLERELERIAGRERHIQSLLADVVRPPDEWAAEPIEPVAGELEDLSARYHKDQLDQQRQHEALIETLGSIEERTYSRYAGEDETESLQKLAEARDALPEQEKAASELWKSIAVGIRENLQNMGSDLETLRSRVNGVNRGLSSINISNLKSIRLTVVDNPQWIKRIKNIRLQDDMPLFAEKGACDAAFEEIGRLLSERSRVELGDLFNLEFEISMPDDTIRKYPHLDRIESNGTTIAIKVLVNLSLLKQLLHHAEVAIPFYLDECSSLDSENLKAIVQTAEAMGFTAILASPEAMDAATRIYFMNEKTDGRVVLDPHQALIECLGTGQDGADDA